MLACFHLQRTEAHTCSWRGLLPGASTPGDSRLITPETTPPSIPTNSATGPLAEPEITLAARVPQQYFPPKTIKAKTKIQPILTPDNYVDLILALINSA